MIEWNVYGKIQKITKIKSGQTTVIQYTYDASGNRISKTVTGSGSVISTYYVRDASGNMMSLYTKDAAINNGALSQTEISEYGSSRLGVWNLNRSVVGIGPINYSAFSNNFIRGNKLFELSNHLGNVLVTVSDRKLQHTTNNTSVDFYEVDVIGANDYYSFGMQMPGKSYTSGSSNYRYGFNGKEKDKDIAAGDLDFGARIYDSRLGRFLSIDPLAYVHPFNSPYQFAANKPIIAIDADGLLEIYVTVSIKGKDGKVTTAGTFKIHITTAEEVVYGLYRTPVYVQVNAHEKDQYETIYSTRVNEVNNFGIVSGGYDKYQSMQSVSSPWENLATDGAVEFSKITGVSGFMEAADGETIEGVQLNTANRVVNGIAGAEKFASLVTAKGRANLVGGIITDKIEDQLIDALFEGLINTCFADGNTEKSVVKDQSKEIMKGVYTSAKLINGTKGNLVKAVIAFLQAQNAAQRLSDAINANPGGVLPYGPEEAASQAVNLFLQPGGWGDSREHRVELTVPMLEQAEVKTIKKKKE